MDEQQTPALPVWVGLLGYVVLTVMALFALIAAWTGEWDVALADGAIVAVAVAALRQRAS